MTAITLMLPGLVGGALLAVLLLILNRRSSGATSLPPRKLEPLTTDLINMAHIRVAGVGGLGLVAAAAVIAVNVPEIGWSLLAGVTLGGALAIALVAYRSPRPDSRGRDGRPSPPMGILIERPSPSATRSAKHEPSPDLAVAIA